MMTSHNLKNMEKIPGMFLPSPIPGSFAGHGHAMVVIGTLDVFSDETPSLDEREKAASMTSDEGRARFLAGRRLVRGVIRRWFGTETADAPIHHDVAGKPFLQGEEMPLFSISHSGELVAAVFSEKASGIDLELERDVDAAALARRFFSQSEAALLEGDCDQDLFFRLWVCREAAIKGNGRGMASLLAGTEVLSPMTEIPYSVMVQGESWQTIPFNLAHGYHGAVAFRELPQVILWCDLR
jgi:4'-phosphopantetheinyl transferase